MINKVVDIKTWIGLTGGVGRCAVGEVGLCGQGGAWNARWGVGTARAGEGGLRL
jgi:hypothetical protein